MADNKKRVHKYILEHKEGTWIERISKELDLSRITAAKYVFMLHSAGKIKIVQHGGIKMLYPVEREI